MHPTDTCPCGKIHASPTKIVAIGRGALARIPEICAPYRRILAVADRSTFAACGERAVALLGAQLSALHIFPSSALIPDEAALAEIEARLGGIDHIVGIGSGVINDLCKQVAHTHCLRYTVVATAPSMDGYASAGAALTLGGMKVTLSATPPEAIIGDTEVLAAAPMDMIRAGYGDIIGKYSCLNDWKLAAFVRGEYICPAVWQWVRDTADRVRALAADIANRDPDAIEALMRALVDVGLAMAYVGNSRPASGSEHHIAHYLEITGILHGRPALAHGVDVACGAVMTAALREEICRRDPILHPFDRNAYAAAMGKVYGALAPSVIALQEKTGFYTEAATEAFILSHTEEIRTVLAEAPTEAETREMVEAVGLSFADFTAYYGAETLAEATAWGKDLKDRYTVLWLYRRFYE